MSGRIDGMSIEQPVNVDRDLVDFSIVAEWMDSQGLPTGPFEGVSAIGGGTQNVLLRFKRGGRDFVLRRPPKHLRAKSNEVLYGTPSWHRERLCTFLEG